MRLKKYLYHIIGKLFGKLKYRKIKIFTVDDVEYYSKLVQVNLQKMGYNDIKMFHNGEDIIEYLKTDIPDCIILDHILSDGNKMNGIDVLKYIKLYYPSINVIILSGQEKVEVAANMIKEGSYDYILKNSMTFFRLQNIISHLETNINNEEQFKWHDKTLRMILLSVILLSWCFIYTLL